MNSSKTLLLSFLLASLGLWLLLGLADGLHPRLRCQPAEKIFWTQRDGAFVFERVSSFYWSSLCRPSPKPLIISASEGTGELSFPEVAAGYGVQADEFSGAHRGLKTLGYLLATPMHPERLQNLRILALINPVYFSFAASTDSSSVRLTSISNLSYFLRLPAVQQKWDEFLLDSLFIGAKSYLEEWRKFQTADVGSVIASVDGGGLADPALFDLERNMLVEKTAAFTSFRSPFHAKRQPARFIFDRVVDFAHSHPEAKICYVMLPTNTKNLRYFNRDADKIAREMSELMSLLPEASRLDLQSLNEEPFMFLDPMHLTDLGKRRVMEEVMKSSCGKKVFE